MGASVEDFDDGLVIAGPAALHGAPVRAFGDHRLAMALAVAALVSDGPTEIDDAAAVALSYPRCFHDLASLAR